MTREERQACIREGILLAVKSLENFSRISTLENGPMVLSMAAAAIRETADQIYPGAQNATGT